MGMMVMSWLSKVLSIGFQNVSFVMQHLRIVYVNYITFEQSQ